MKAKYLVIMSVIAIVSPWVAMAGETKVSCSANSDQTSGKADSGSSDTEDANSGKSSK